MADEEVELEPARRRAGIYLLPNLFTTGAMFAGFYAIVSAINGQYVMAAWAVLIAGVLDGLDGRVARLTNTQSDFGVQYDSLSDLISFGLAPALVMYLWSLRSLVEYGPIAGKIGWLAAFLYAACAALRLARFNTQVAVVDKRYFQGLASPAAAACLITLVWVCESYEPEAFTGQVMNLIALPITICVGLLMVSNVRYYSFKSWPKADKVPFLWITALVILLVLLAIHPPKVLFLIAYGYALSGPIMTVYGRFQHRSRRQSREETPPDNESAPE